MSDPGFVVWLTGLSAAGKSTIAGLVAADSCSAASLIDRLDGDVVREHLSRGLGFSKEDRDTNIAADRLGRLPARPCGRRRRRLRDLALRGGPPAGARADRGARSVRRGPRRDLARGVRAARPERALRDGPRRRDRDFTGVSDPYEEPTNPELRLKTEGRTPEQSAAVVLAKLEELGLLADEVAA